MRLRKIKGFVDKFLLKSDKLKKEKEMEERNNLRLLKIKEEEKKLEAERVRKYIEEQRIIKRMKRENVIEKIRQNWKENGDKMIEKELKMSKMRTRFLKM